MRFIFMTSLSMSISWISTTPATGEAADTRRASASDFRCMNAPVAFCAGTVARTQASATVTSASAGRVQRPRRAARASFFMVVLSRSMRSRCSRAGTQPRRARRGAQARPGGDRGTPKGRPWLHSQIGKRRGVLRLTRVAFSADGRHARAGGARGWAGDHAKSGRGETKNSFGASWLPMTANTGMVSAGGSIARLEDAEQ